MSEIERLHAKARHDEAQALRHAEQIGEQRGEQKGRVARNVEIAQAMISDGESIEKIMRYTGLSRAEIAS